MTSFSEIQVVITVIPCYNEESSIAQTCYSLGFGINDSKQNIRHLLVLIDNNSTDSTYSIIQKIQDNSKIGTVHIYTEMEVGYVPARHRGNELARSIVSLNGWSDRDVLILQADADTIYSPNYIQEMSMVAADVGENVLIEACVTYEPKLIEKYKPYFDLCYETDEKVLSCFQISDKEEIIVDDKVCGYRLSDYFLWGGHVREYFSNGSEVYAETTRLYMQAKIKGAEKVTVQNAEAIHSMRKLIADTTLHFATAGFPRESIFKEKFKLLGLKIDIDNIEIKKLYSSLKPLIEIRSLHVIALFVMLPLYIKIQNGIKVSGLSILEQFLVSLLPDKIEQKLTAPGKYFEYIFNIIETDDKIILNKINL